MLQRSSKLTERSLCLEIVSYLFLELNYLQRTDDSPSRHRHRVRPSVTEGHALGLK